MVTDLVARGVTRFFLRGNRPTFRVALYELASPQLLKQAAALSFSSVAITPIFYLPSHAMSAARGAMPELKMRQV